MLHVFYRHRNGTLVAGFLFDAITGVQTPIAANTTYNIVTNDYLSRGGDGFDSIAAGTIILPSGTPLDQLIVARLQVGSSFSTGVISLAVVSGF